MDKNINTEIVNFIGIMILSNIILNQFVRNPSLELTLFFGGFCYIIFRHLKNRHERNKKKFKKDEKYIVLEDD